MFEIYRDFSGKQPDQLFVNGQPLSSAPSGYSSKIELLRGPDQKRAALDKVGREDAEILETHVYYTMEWPNSEDPADDSRRVVLSAAYYSDQFGKFVSYEYMDWGVDSE